MNSDWYRITVGGLIALGLVGGWLTYRSRRKAKDRINRVWPDEGTYQVRISRDERL
jgi:hypothetical protein